MNGREGTEGTGKQEQISRNRKSGSYEHEGTYKYEQNREHMVRNIYAGADKKERTSRKKNRKQISRSR